MISEQVVPHCLAAISVLHTREQRQATAIPPSKVIWACYGGILFLEDIGGFWLSIGPETIVALCPRMLMVGAKKVMSLLAADLGLTLENFGI